MKATVPPAIEQNKKNGGKLRSLFPAKELAANDQVIYEFLPAAIEVEHSPASKAGRLIIWLIVTLFIIAVLWASFGKVDIVAVAQGKVIPSEGVKQIQALETARIQAIHIKEGQKVVQGEMLIELDDTLVRAELESLKAERKGVEQNLLRLAQLTAFLESPELSSANLAMREIDTNMNPSQGAQLLQEQHEIRAQLANFENEQASLKAEQGMTQAEIIKKQEVLPVLKERVDALDTLQKKSFGSKLQYLELKQELIEEQQDLAVQQSRLNQLIQSKERIITQQALYLAEKRKQTLAEQNALQVQAESLQQQVRKAEQRLQHYTLRAPIDGEVQQLAATTVEGVVQSAQPLMQIVPTDSALEVDVMILNKDIGFVHEGQTVEVKVDTFNFTKYGLIEGQLESISDDAVSYGEGDENLGLVYKGTVSLNREGLQVGERFVRLSPGMSVTAEVKTGTRRLIEYFLSPLLRYQDESLGER